MRTDSELKRLSERDVAWFFFLIFLLSERREHSKGNHLRVSASVRRGSSSCVMHPSTGDDRRAGAPLGWGNAASPIRWLEWGYSTPALSEESVADIGTR